MVYTDRFTVSQVVGRTVIVIWTRTTSPRSRGQGGERNACGIIQTAP